MQRPGLRAAPGSNPFNHLQYKMLPNIPPESRLRRVVGLIAFTLVATGFTCAPEATREAANTGSPLATSTARQIDSADARLEPAPDTLRELEVRFLDVGQGDAVLLRSWAIVDGDRHSTHVALVDAGPVNRIVARLRELGIAEIDLLIASHNHLDHIGGMDAILDSLPVRFYLDNGHPAATRIQQRVLERVEARGLTYLQPSRRRLALGPAQLQVIPPPLAPADDDQNNRSVMILVEHGRFRVLLTGDAETPLLNALLASGDIPRVEVLKASHHGSRNGVTPAWLARTRPSVVVISVGADNSYGHPHAAALRYYCSGGRQVLRTDVHGDLVFRVDAEGNYTVHAGHPEPMSLEAATVAACGTYSAVIRDASETYRRPEP